MVNYFSQLCKFEGRMPKSCLSYYWILHQKNCQSNEVLKCLWEAIHKLSKLTQNLTFIIECNWTFIVYKSDELSLWPDWVIYWTLGDFSKPIPTINLPKSPTFLSFFCKFVKILNFSSEIIFWETFIDIWQFFTGHTVNYTIIGCIFYTF